MTDGREAVAWSTMAAILTIARLCEPSSELHIAEDWYRRTALEDLLGVPAEQVNDDRLYRALDQLLPHKAAIEQHLRQRLGELFALDLLLYDVTSTYFEGQALGNPQAKRGHSRDHRPDCKQVCIALVVTREGIPLGYEVFDGNRVDVTTVEEIVGTMETRFGIAGRVWVMDRGMTSAANIAWLQKTGRRYLVGTPKSARSRKPLDRGTIERQIGRLLGSNSRAAGRFIANLVDDPSTGAKLRLQWSARNEWDDWSRHSEGCYVLRSNVNDWTPEALWQTYVQLTEAEAAFRIHKSDLSIRPIWHHKQGRVQAHIFVCFLAYAMWKTLEQWQKRAGLGNSPRTILYELGRIYSTDVVLPLARDPQRQVRIRCVVRPDPAQAALLDRLGLRLPERLRPPSTSCEL